MISILTGDIVGSQDLTPEMRTHLFSHIKEAAEFVNLGDTLEIYAGDSWQAMSPSVENVLSVALIFRVYLLGIYQIETRISIGIGEAETIRREKISLSQGEAFVLSGRGLEEMDKKRRISIYPSESLPDANRSLLAAATALIDGLSSHWTPKQAQAVALHSYSVLPHRGEQKQKELADKFDPPITPQAYGKHLSNAQWNLVKAALNTIAYGLRETLAQKEQ